MRVTNFRGPCIYYFVENFHLFLMVSIHLNLHCNSTKYHQGSVLGLILFLIYSNISMKVATNEVAVKVTSFGKNEHPLPLLTDSFYNYCLSL